MNATSTEFRTESTNDLADSVLKQNSEIWLKDPRECAADLFDAGFV
jgi:hypothetical protein